MFEDEEDLAESVVYMACKNCGSVNYDNADCPDPEFTPDGLVMFLPITCDLCNFELLLSDSDLIH